MKFRIVVPLGRVVMAAWREFAHSIMEVQAQLRVAESSLRWSIYGSAWSPHNIPAAYYAEIPLNANEVPARADT